MKVYTLIPLHTNNGLGKKSFSMFIMKEKDPPGFYESKFPGDL